MEQQMILFGILVGIQAAYGAPTGSKGQLLQTFDRVQEIASDGPGLGCAKTSDPSDGDFSRFFDPLPTAEQVKADPRSDWKWLQSLTVFDPMKPDEDELDMMYGRMEPTALFRVRIGNCRLVLKGSYRILKEVKDDEDMYRAVLGSIQSLRLLKKVEGDCSECSMHTFGGSPAEKVRPLFELEAQPPKTESTLKPDDLAPLRPYREKLKQACS
jgi:hypothetical protein